LKEDTFLEEDEFDILSRSLDLEDDGEVRNSLELVSIGVFGRGFIFDLLWSNCWD